MIDPAHPPQNTETFRSPTCFAATARRSVKFFPYPIGRTAKTCRSAALQPSKTSISSWVLALNLENRVLQSKTQRGTTSFPVPSARQGPDYCTLKNKSDFEHAQLTRGPDSGLRNRILPDLVSSSLHSPPLSPLPPPPPPPFFVLEPPKRDRETRSTPYSIAIDRREVGPRSLLLTSGP